MGMNRRGRKTKRVYRGNNFVLIVILIAVVFLVTLIIGQSEKTILSLKQGDTRVFVLNQEEFLSEKGIQSANALLIRLKDGKVLLDLNSEERVYPASITKIMTALVAIEKMGDPNDRCVVDLEIFEPLRVRNASMAGFLPEEIVTVEDLLYGCLLPSGADASVSLAIHIAGSEADFVDMMNEKAMEIGMKDTKFRNVTGLHDPTHYTTMQDIAVMVRYALENTKFKEIFTAEQYTTGATYQHPKGLTFYSPLNTSHEGMVTFPGGTMLGGKTGYTGEAGLCLASFAEKNGREYLLITAGAKGTVRGEPLHINDAVKIYGDYIIR
ncbi:MAG: D-alanyl-D-alanine carboxypeptidase family protein [Anaerovoracaceae bacterium]|jgi:D-alanyl-D-alanine carboxypeptidase (penicillin-binding protein 5/6)